jgi:hypothetical protein
MFSYFFAANNNTIPETQNPEQSQHIEPEKLPVIPESDVDALTEVSVIQELEEFFHNGSLKHIEPHVRVSANDLCGELRDFFLNSKLKPVSVNEKTRLISKQFKDFLDTRARILKLDESRLNELRFKRNLIEEKIASLNRELNAVIDEIDEMTLNKVVIE